MARIDIEDLEQDREIKKEEMKKAFGGFGVSSGTSIPGPKVGLPNPRVGLPNPKVGDSSPGAGGSTFWPKEY